jgi:alkylhydroperoxidase family enzyme
VALRYADAITWDPSAADDAMWAELKRHFSEPELVELGYLIGVFAGGQRWIHTLQVQHGDVAAESTTGYRPELVRPTPSRRG